MISSDVLGLCETWLRPGELPLIQSSLSNMPEHKSGSGYYYITELDTNSDRIVAIKVCAPSGDVIQVIICVYMPFSNEVTVNRRIPL